MKSGLIAVAVLGLLVAQPAVAEIYKCRLANGKVEIANMPCAKGSDTVTARPDETVPEANRQQAERDVERMRSFVEKREAAQSAEAAAERQASQRQSANPAPRNYGDPEACLQQLNQQALEASQRAALEAECRSRIQPPATAPSPIYVPAYGIGRQPPHHEPRPPPKMEPKPAPAPSVVICPPASKNCGR